MKLPFSIGWGRLALVALCAAALIAWGAIGRIDRDKLAAWGSTVCASAGRQLKPAEGERGEECAKRIAALAQLERDTLKASNTALADARARDNARADRDLAWARADLTRAAQAIKTMEKENEAIGPDDHVGGSWFDALNRVAGLRPPAP